MAKTDPVIPTLKIPVKLKNALDAYAQATGKPITAIVREALILFLAKETGPTIRGEDVVRFLTDPETPQRIRNARSVIDALGGVLVNVDSES